MLDAAIRPLLELPFCLQNIRLRQNTDDVLAFRDEDAIVALQQFQNEIKWSVIVDHRQRRIHDLTNLLDKHRLERLTPSGPIEYSLRRNASNGTSDLESGKLRVATLPQHASSR